jgi:hypothetical protein
MELLLTNIKQCGGSKRICYIWLASRSRTVSGLALDLLEMFGRNGVNCCNQNWNGNLHGLAVRRDVAATSPTEVLCGSA